MKLKNIMYRNFDSLTNDEKKFYDDNQEKYNLGICDKYNTVETRLIYIEYDFEFLSDNSSKSYSGYINTISTVLYLSHIPKLYFS